MFENVRKLISFLDLKMSIFNVNINDNNNNNLNEKAKGNAIDLDACKRDNNNGTLRLSFRLFYLMSLFLFFSFNCLFAFIKI